ncbi:O-antigen polymerase [[Leptolyngbya] sp. PCC 7376]|uniref:O-antigen ligase family protein n=1 Tax=[Leptolyngbya] sp. PCC 7376 TaxID=111781 RepID=UPI00029F1899|nr:O-antigen ligase family protein [[Leptolyngbya] sp. PCC 7376]AFY37304.1 O-antigen polymerase [[Leptolyngbya] sp. PCC 7376]
MRDRLLRVFSLSLGLITFGVYGWAVLMPDNHSLIVGFPWFYLVQGGFLCGGIWAIANIWGKQDDESKGLVWLGGGLDWIIFCLIATLSLSLLTAQFTEIAVLYSAVDIAYVGILYGLHHFWLRQPKNDEPQSLLTHPLLLAQGLLCIGFSVWSLTLWLKDTVSPELSRLADLRALGIEASYRFSSVTLRNWATFGHPNYVAGFLLLALPLLISLAIAAKSWQRWLWIVGCGMSVVAFYSTNSRGGWLGLFVAFGVIVILLLRKSSLPRRWLSFSSVAGFTLLVIWATQNDRLRGTFTGLFTLGQQGGEFAYRWITAYTGWQMGWDQPLAGQGLGSTALLYQEFRPVWAGLEAEILFQLHSTPVQIWAELGFTGILTIVLGLFLLTKMWWKLLQPNIWEAIASEDKLLLYAIGAAGAGYSVMALTDYQLDVIAITGFLLLYISLLTNLYHRYVTPVLSLKPIFQPLALSLIGLTLVGILSWSIPMNTAFAYSHQAFQSLRQEKLENFVDQLTTAYSLAPWQPYYAYQLGWSLGEVALWGNNPSDISQTLREEAILWFQRAIATSPNYEFGQSSLGWLTLVDTPTVATGYFSRALELMPYHRLTLVGLGESWLKRGEPEKAIEAIAIEFVRFPAFATSPLWLDPKWQEYYPAMLRRTDEIFTALLDQTDNKNQALQTWLHQNRGAIRWYYGNDLGAAEDFQASNFSLGQLLLDLDNIDPETWQQDLTSAQIQAFESAINNNEKWALAIAAWLSPDEAEFYLKKALHSNNQTEILNYLQSSLKDKNTLRDWVRNKEPLRPNRIRRLGFNVISRHLGGNQPSDFGAFYDNIPVTNFFGNLFTSLRYAPELDLALSEYWQPLLESSPAPELD